MGIVTSLSLFNLSGPIDAEEITEIIVSALLLSKRNRREGKVMQNCSLESNPRDRIKACANELPSRKGKIVERNGEIRNSFRSIVSSASL